jgi:hypothetical protein
MIFSTFELFDWQLTSTEDLQNLNQMNFETKLQVTGHLEFKKMLQLKRLAF